MEDEKNLRNLKMSYWEKSDKILKFISVLSIIALCWVLVIWALFSGKISFNLIDFRFTDFISLILAIFSMCLSVLFYFKATNSSEQFYHHSLTFTKNISEILGEIKAGFGERLRHLDEVYSNMSQNIGRYSDKDDKKILKDKEDLHKELEEKEKIINDLAAKANIIGPEREKLILEIREKDNKILKLKSEIEKLKTRNQKSTSHIKIAPMIGYFKKRIMTAEMEAALIFNDFEQLNFELNKYLSEHSETISSFFIEDMQKVGLLDNELHFTKEGFEIFKRYLNEE